MAGLAPADVTIVVDVLSFSTCVDVATARGAAILPYSWSDWNDPSAAEFAKAQANQFGYGRSSRR